MYAILRDVNEGTTVKEELDSFAVVSGLSANHTKCAALPVGTWDTNTDVGWNYAEKIKVLGVTFTATIKTTIDANWPGLVTSLRGTLIDNGNRNLSLSQRAWFCATFALSKLWHVAQVLPITKAAVVDIRSLTANFIWRGFLFRAPLHVVTRPRLQGGLGFPDVRLKCVSLFTGRWNTIHLQDPDGLSAEWLEALRGFFPVANPPHTPAVWPAAVHYVTYLETAAYEGLPPGAGKAATRELYASLLAADVARHPPPRVVARHPNTNWDQVWLNLNSRGHTVYARRQRPPVCLCA
jgi:hypothetical protein